MEFEQEDSIAHPANQVLDIMIQHMEALVPFLPNVERIDTLEKEELPDGRQRIVRRWQAGSNNLPAALRLFVMPEWLTWIDTALWEPAAYKVNWTLSTKLGHLYDCSGTNYFEPERKAAGKRTRIRVTGNLTIYPDRIPGIPRLLTTHLAPVVERFIINLITPNLTSVAKGVDRYLTPTSRR